MSYLKDVYPLPRACLTCKTIETNNFTLKKQKPPDVLTHLEDTLGEYSNTWLDSGTGWTRTNVYSMSSLEVTGLTSFIVSVLHYLVVNQQLSRVLQTIHLLTTSVVPSYSWSLYLCLNLGCYCYRSICKSQVNQPSTFVLTSNT